MLLRQLARAQPVASSSKLLHTSSSLLAPLPTTIASALKESTAASSTEPITIYGWIRSCRRQKNVSFAVINDGSSMGGVQAVLSKGLDEGLTVGCSASLKGRFVDSLGKGQAKEFKVEQVELLGKSDAETYPIPNTKQGVPATVLRKNAHLRPRATAAAAMLRIRSKMALAVAEHFDSEEFVRVEAPLITSSDCEGAGEVFRVESGPTAPPPPPQPSASTSTSACPSSPPPLLPSPRYLTVSSQLHLEAISSSLNRVYTFSPAFRAEKSDTARHLQEFWMLEAEVGFLDAENPTALEQVMNIAERVIRSVTNRLAQTDDVAYFQSQSHALAAQLDGLTSPQPYARLTYTDAVKVLEAHVYTHPTAFVHPVEWGLSLQTEHEKWLAEQHIGGPVFVTDYPTPMKPFYMLPNPGCAEGRQTTACFDLLVPRLGELIGGSLREHEEGALRESMRQHGIEEKDYEWYLELRRYGTTRHGGFGMGWERLVACLTGLENVRDCIAFPRATEGSRF